MPDYDCEDLFFDTERFVTSGFKIQSQNLNSIQCDRVVTETIFVYRSHNEWDT